MDLSKKEMLVNFCHPSVDVIMIFRTSDDKTEFLYINENGQLKSKKISLTIEAHKKFMSCMVKHHEIIRSFRNRI